MKNIKIILATALAALTLTACSSDSEPKLTTGQVAVQKMQEAEFNVETTDVIGEIDKLTDVITSEVSGKTVAIEVNEMSLDRLATVQDFLTTQVTNGKIKSLDLMAKTSVDTTHVKGVALYSEVVSEVTMTNVILITE